MSSDRYVRFDHFGIRSSTEDVVLPSDAVYVDFRCYPRYTIRPARRSDSRFIYDLSMDPRIRFNSTRQEEFTFEDHEKWYAEKLSNGLNAIWVMEVGGIPVGQVRYGGVPYSCDMGHDICSFGKAEIAISIVPHEWRNGYALALLTETMPLACEWLKVDTLVALVLRGNYGSRRLFRRVGFRYVGVEERMGRCHARYEWSV